MINNKGSITLLAIYICSFILLLSIIVKSIFLENYNYFNYQKKYNLFLIENMIVKNIYDDYKNIKHNANEFSYKAKTVNSYEDDDIIFEIKVIVKGDIYTYEAVYDKICERILSFNDTTIVNRV